MGRRVQYLDEHICAADADASALGYPEDFEGIGAYLCSDASSFMTGETVYHRRRLHDPALKRGHLGEMR